MNKFIWGILVVVVAIAAWKLYPMFISSGGPSAPENLKPGATEFGALQVTVVGQNQQPLAGVAVDLGTLGTKGPTGPMAEIKTTTAGVAMFEKVPVGTYDIFWNTNVFPKGYDPSVTSSVTITQGKTTQKRIELAAK